ncbi:hypothetical protein NDU88_003094 [Pleurodeles waltl]|uniref:Uncharacterized protein n=1 Tax=Pleurodeles waltl TaxID=8319 RepID=A0AAV7T4G3_PLEWA|nr:hypothetical protein NDU88_003094 [Pleurodeles waltl]
MAAQSGLEVGEVDHHLPPDHGGTICLSTEEDVFGIEGKEEAKETATGVEVMKTTRGWGDGYGAGQEGSELLLHCRVTPVCPVVLCPVRCAAGAGDELQGLTDGLGDPAGTGRVAGKYAGEDYTVGFTMYTLYRHWILFAVASRALLG